MINMSLTSEVEMSEMFGEKPAIKYHKPRWMGDTPTCDRTTGHCTNTSSCEDRCEFYKSMMKIKEYKMELKGD